MYATAVGWYNQLKAVLSNPIPVIINAVFGGPSAGEIRAEAATLSGLAHTGPLGLARGPLSGAFDNLRYESYAGHQKNPLDALVSGGNCVDMSLGLMYMGHMMGLPTRLVSGLWDGGPHVWAEIGGKAFDPARKALQGTWAPPARGPGDSSDVSVDVPGVKKVSNTMTSAENVVNTGSNKIAGRLKGLAGEAKTQWDNVANSTIPPVNRILNILQRLFQATGGKLTSNSGSMAAGGLGAGSVKELGSGGAGPGIFNGTGNWINQILGGVNNRASNILGFDLSQFGPLDWSNPAEIFKAFATALFRTFHYEFYFDDQKSNLQTLMDRGGNCFDTTQLLMSLASAFGLGSSMVHGTWDGVGHVWANIQGLGNMDSTAMMVRGNWNPPSGGPMPKAAYGGGETHIHFHGDVYGYKDFEKKVNKVMNRNTRKIVLN
jgi:hypothetical protein